ncbi:hypothetical protein [Streptomyces acidiscabies]|uniref:Uncharacterized protein n=1 Tax=Streptomyces acidiscabies TaxID=42234 RepID=A0A0L0KL66_9ACTN|nr:hypothetical protein [Streptomyces acidiscabies]KND38319.1 hypothetical protein IQ63_08155 [Streptomyces acidiscabies]
MTSISDALSLRAMASSFDAQRGKLPVLGDPNRSPEPIAVFHQISELGALITELSDEALFRLSDQDPAPHTARAVAAFASAIDPAGQAAAALGTVGQQLSFLAQTQATRRQPDVRDVRETALHVVEDALVAADADGAL